MNPQRNSYLSKNINISNDRINGGKRLGDRTLFSHNADSKRYYSSLDAEIYFGETYIDDVVQINWGVEQATMPLFGYNSYTFDDLAIGARQISGSFVVNFTKSKFMYDVLKNVQAISRASLYTASDATYKLEYTSHFDKEHNASWNRSFNIRIGYGDYTQKGNHTTMVVLHCVQLTGCQQVLSADGGPIGEVYSFVAKDIRYEMDSLPEIDAPGGTGGEGESGNETGKSFVYAIESIAIKESKESSSDGSANNFWNINIKSNYSGGTINKIQCSILNHRRRPITSTPFIIREGNDITETIPKQYWNAISNDIKTQKAIISDNSKLELFVTLQIDYSMDGKPKAPLFKKNILAKVELLTQ